MKKYNVFHRTWWAKNSSWPGGLEPCPGKKIRIAKNVSYNVARQICEEYNLENSPGELSDKAEFDEI